MSSSVSPQPALLSRSRNIQLTILAKEGVVVQVRSRVNITGKAESQYTHL
jgi:hypothetical protein